MTDRLAGVVLAAGAGTRLRPLTDLRPKALCPVGAVPLLDHALARLAPAVGTGPAHLAVNAHHGADLVVAHVGDRARVSVETPEALGTAGALAPLRDWLDGRDVLLTNADAYLPEGLGRFTDGWDGERCRLLCVPVAGRPDFVIRDVAPDVAPDAAGPDVAPDLVAPDLAAPDVAPPRGLRYVGACLLPWRLVEPLAAEPTGLYEVLWAAQDALGRLDLVTTAAVGLPDTVVDCGTPSQYLAANLEAVRRAGRSIIGPGAVVTGRVEQSVVGAGARVEGDVVRSVVWDGGHVAAGERLVGAVRTDVRADVRADLRTDVRADLKTGLTPDGWVTVSGDTGTLGPDR